MAAALGALRLALAAGVGPDETIDSSQLRDLVAGRLTPDAEQGLLDALDLPLAVRDQLARLKRSKSARDIARRVAGGPGIDPLGVTAPPVYHLDGPHGGVAGAGIGAESVFSLGDRVEIIARPSGPVAQAPPVSLWAGLREGPLRRVEGATVQRDASGVYRLLIDAEALFESPGRWRLVLVLGEEEMAPRRAEVTESMVQVLRAWAVYATR